MTLHTTATHHHQELNVGNISDVTGPTLTQLERKVSGIHNNNNSNNNENKNKNIYLILTKEGSHATYSVPSKLSLQLVNASQALEGFDQSQARIPEHISTEEH